MVELVNSSCISSILASASVLDAKVRTRVLDDFPIRLRSFLHSSLDQTPQHQTDSGTGKHVRLEYETSWVMVLLGLGILVASISFFVYRHQPAVWSLLLRARKRKEISADESRGNTKTGGLAFIKRGNKNDENNLIWDGEPLDFSEPAPRDKLNDLHQKNSGTQIPMPSFVLDDASSHDTENEFVPSTSKSPLRNKTSDNLCARISHGEPQDGQQSKPPPPSKPNSSRRAQQNVTSGSIMPPPPLPSKKPKNSQAVPKANTALRPPPSVASSLRAPPSRSLALPSLPIPASSSTLSPSSRPSRKVLLAPGHSPLDWAHLIKNPPSRTYLRGASVPQHLIRVTPSQVQYHNGRKGMDAWGVWQGKVYNLTPYLDFHPGGVGELMRGAGKIVEAEKLFREVHPWINWEGMLGECMVGILVGENEEKEARNGERITDLDEMD
ncbi:hypothetical protein MMC06_001519 [Schaereria dolodes]|nr:hypothetical protein [Schaereria dolodes]